MKKGIATLCVLGLLLCATMTGCHEHKWNEATCAEPKTCSDCGATEGEALDHVWVEATCAAPKTCSRCGETEGVALEHTWEQANCTKAMTCSVCGATSGNALGHDTPKLTCTEGDVCARCGETIAAPGHKYSEATCTKPATCEVCGAEDGEALGHTVSSGICARCNLEVYETIQGSGDDVVSGIELGTGLYRAHFTYSGRRNFIVKGYDATNNSDLLINEIGSYDGYVFLSGSAPLSFEITAGGAWSFTIERLTSTTDISFGGKGDFVTNMSSAKSGTWQFTHDGRSNFVVWMYSTNGRDLLVNEIGAYSGKKIVNIPAGSNVVFVVTADGNWSISPAE